MTNVFAENSDYWTYKDGIPSILQGYVEVLEKRSSALDLGCGGGRLARGLLKYFDSVTGIDCCHDLIKAASELNPEIRYVAGHFNYHKTWIALGLFDLIISNCAIRKDYCNIKDVIKFTLSHLNPGGVLLLRIQSYNDLATVLPAKNRTMLYAKEELIQFGYVQSEIFRQNFSSSSYLKESIAKINMSTDNMLYDLRPIRQYYVLKIVKPN